MKNTARPRSKISYINYDEIQNYIKTGELNAYDVVFTKDTHENIIIKPDLDVMPVRSKIYRFTDVESCEEILNKSTDTYEGQIVAVLHNDSYTAYIVNKNNKNLFYVSPLNSFEGQVDYNSLGNRPIVNIESDSFTPTILDDLESGIYKINGSYKLSATVDAVFTSVSSNLFLVEHTEDITRIKIISTGKITDYAVSSDGNTTTSVVPTTEWLTEQGYVTEKYVDAKIAALDFITREDVEEYVSDVVLKNIDSLVNERIDEALSKKLTPVDEREALEIFTREFYKI